MNDKFLVLVKRYWNSSQYKYSHKYTATIAEAEELMAREQQPTEIYKRVAKKATDSKHIRK